MMISDYYIFKNGTCGEQRKPRFSQRVPEALLLRCLPPGQKKQKEEYTEAHLNFCPTLPAPRYSYHLFFPGSFRKLWTPYTGREEAWWGESRNLPVPEGALWVSYFLTWAFFCNYVDVYPHQANSSSLESRYWVYRKVMLMENESLGPGATNLGIPWVNAPSGII